RPERGRPDAHRVPAPPAGVAYALRRPDDVPRRPGGRALEAVRSHRPPREVPAVDPGARRCRPPRGQRGRTGAAAGRARGREPRGRDRPARTLRPCVRPAASRSGRAAAGPRGRTGSGRSGMSIGTDTSTPSETASAAQETSPAAESVTMTKALNRALRDSLADDENVLVFGED